MRLMIVDDDKQIREGIMLGIPWKKYGFEEVKAYQDGEEAHEDFEVFKPDIILSDIKMPNMDGLQLLKKVREKSDSTKYILLSAYSDFEYCKEAILLGANDYELKPVNPTKLINTIMNNAKDLLEERKDEENYYKVLESALLQSIIYEKNTFDQKQIKEYLKIRHGIDDIGFTIVTLIRIEHKTKSKIDNNVFLSIRDELVEEDSAIIKVSETLIMYLYKANNSTIFNINIQNRIKNKIIYLNNKLGKEELRISAGISAAQQFEHLHLAYVQANKALESNFYNLYDNCIIYGLNYINVEEDIIELLQNKYIKMLQDAISKSDMNKIQKIFQELEINFKEKRYNKKKVKNYLKKICFHFTNYVNDLNSIDGIKTGIDQSYYFDDCISIVYEFFEEIVKTRKFTENEKKCSNIIKKVMVFLREHYSEQITVDYVAELYQITPNYLSSKFKKEVGVSFTDYLVDIRMKEALRLLKNTNMQINEIAEKVGYGSYAYFSRTFRKKVGKSAGHYRNKVIN